MNYQLKEMQATSDDLKASWSNMQSGLVGPIQFYSTQIEKQRFILVVLESENSPLKASFSIHCQGFNESTTGSVKSTSTTDSGMISTTTTDTEAPLE